MPEARRVGSQGRGVGTAISLALSASGRADRGTAGGRAALDRRPARSHAAAGSGAGGGKAAAGQLPPPHADRPTRLRDPVAVGAPGAAHGRGRRPATRRRGLATRLLFIGGKGGRYDELPLPDDVGRALVSYPRRRPRCPSRAVFVRVTAPHQELNRSTIGRVVRAACDRAGLPRVGAHRLRHTAATEMLRRGASLAEIGEVLRHRQQKSTALYAKVDRTALRPLARPWPTTQVEPAQTREGNVRRRNIDVANRYAGEPGFATMEVDVQRPGEIKGQATTMLPEVRLLRRDLPAQTIVASGI